MNWLVKMKWQQRDRSGKRGHLAGNRFPISSHHVAGMRTKQLLHGSKPRIEVDKAGTETPASRLKK